MRVAKQAQNTSLKDSVKPCNLWKWCVKVSDHLQSLWTMFSEVQHQNLHIKIHMNNTSQLFWQAKHIKEHNHEHFKNKYVLINTLTRFFYIFFNLCPSDHYKKLTPNTFWYFFLKKWNIYDHTILHGVKL